MADYDGVETPAGRALLDRFAPITTQSLGAANDAEWKVRSALAADIRAIEQADDIPDGHDHVAIRIDRKTRTRLRERLFRSDMVGVGFTDFIERAIDRSEDFHGTG